MIQQEVSKAEVLVEPEDTFDPGHTSTTDSCSVASSREGGKIRDGVWSYFVDEFWWILEECEVFVAEVAAKYGGFVLGRWFPNIRQVERADLRRTWWIKYNPLYWFMIAVLATSMFLGKLWHALFCQGRKLRPDETDVERKVRIWWVYCFSGSFLPFIVVDAVRLFCSIDVRAVARGDVSTLKESEALGQVLSIIIELSYILGNVNLLHQMRKRETWLMHMSAAGKISVGLAFILIAMWGCVRYARSDLSHLNVSIALTFALRSAFGLFMFVTICGYWDVMKLRYEKESVVDRSFLCQALFGILFVVYPFALVLVAFMIGGDAVWVGMVGF